MIDVVDLWAGAATIGCGALAYAYLSLRIDRDEARADLTVEKNVTKGLEGRVKTLRSDNIALEREIGRLKAEAVATKPKRGANGRFVSKRPKPISCG